MLTKGSFIAFEGVDGSGKSTQIDLLERKLLSRGLEVRVLHFPRTQEPVVGELIAMFLRGDLGNVEAVHPRLVALMFAADRFIARQEIAQLRESGKFVIVDRYVYSNIAFQRAKLKSKEEKETLSRWIESLEFECFKIPKPDLSLYLQVPPGHVAKVLRGGRHTRDRGYLLGKADIHEDSLELQERVSQEYEALSKRHSDLVSIQCEGFSHTLLPAETISVRVENALSAADLF
jgi:dTMP kinase